MGEQNFFSYKERIYRFHLNNYHKFAKVSFVWNVQKLNFWRSKEEK